MADNDHNIADKRKKIIVSASAVVLMLSAVFQMYGVLLLYIIQQQQQTAAALAACLTCAIFSRRYHLSLYEEGLHPFLLHKVAFQGVSSYCPLFLE